MHNYLMEINGNLQPIDPKANYQNGPYLDEANELVVGKPILIDRNSPFSLYHEHSFVDSTRVGESTIKYPSLAHYLAYQTSQLPDPKARERILKTNPTLSGILGYYSYLELSELLERGLKERLKNDPAAIKLLVAMKGTIGYADPYDLLFGIGMNRSDIGVDQVKGWPGKNLLGRTLMVVRGELGGEKSGRPVIEPAPLALPKAIEQPPIVGPSIPTDNVIVKELDPRIKQLRDKYQLPDGKYKVLRDLSDNQKKSLPREAFSLGITAKMPLSKLYTEMLLILHRGEIGPGGGLVQAEPIIEPENISELKKKYKNVRGYKKYNTKFINVVEEAQELGLPTAGVSDKDLYDQIIVTLKKYD